jgi:hypothetical protein
MHKYILPLLIVVLLPAFFCFAQSQINETPYAYLFSHMTSEKYGRLFYSVSMDGLHWKKMNKGEPVMDSSYWGHSDIIRGHDGKYYMPGNNRTGKVADDDITIWQSDDLIIWKFFAKFGPTDILAMRKGNLKSYGAPKLYYDTTGKQYVLSWHTPNEARVRNNMDTFWRSMVVYYTTSKDLRSFSPTKKLFPWDFGNIDVILRHVNNQWYAFIKDEMMPSSSWPTGKSIRLSTAPSLEGPWAYPQEQISPNWREAPTLVQKLDGSGWYLYYEQYPGNGYEVSTATHLNGPWYELFTNWYQIPANTRHGSVITITKGEYDRLIAAFGLEN